MQVSAAIAASLLTGSFDVSALTQQPGNTALTNFTNNDNKTNQDIDYSNSNGSDEIGNSTYFDEAEYVARSYGPRFLSPAKAWALSSVYAFILSTGLLGNICTCIVIYKNKAMHTATNFYLFSLAVSDLTTLIFACILLEPIISDGWAVYKRLDHFDYGKYQHDEIIDPIDPSIHTQPYKIYGSIVKNKMRKVGNKNF